MSLLVSRNGRVSMNIDRSKIYKSDTEKLFGLKFDKKLTFDDHISDICKKSRQKNICFSQSYTTHDMGITKKRILMNAFFTSQFS